MRATHADGVVYHVESMGLLSGTFPGVNEVVSWFMRVGELTAGTWRDEILSVLGGSDQVVILVRVTGQRGERRLDTLAVQIFHLTAGKIDQSWGAFEDGVPVDAVFS